MSGVNVQISVTNLTQIDRHQNDIHKTPGVHQEQNAQTAHEAAQKRVQMPVEADAVEKKKVDGEREQRRGFKRKVQKRLPDQHPEVKKQHVETEHFFDVQG